ncbi:unnamed protein product (macronuclear) [Paramecium tetraurelia]|uniref:RING-type E3 ubiquitin transferase n=1 Tax=Paramecium tetraurelia TaxID=5888 RepID=A0CKY7_PARTE|nr:uncharacterized protein GSPATT00008001001 [Paramecium tetraurelia]CAK71454.1 unnamed protein product [Paramecium tetraurelia]|eukprot:XP_001438851.1 hypothetical protein (macronuclear) [Paramecium tetraurelia strain d4-2]
MDSKNDQKQRFTRPNGQYSKTINNQHGLNREEPQKTNFQQQQQQQSYQQTQSQASKVAPLTEIEKIKKENAMLKSELLISKEQLKNLTEDYQNLQQRYHELQSQVRYSPEDLMLLEMQRQMKHQQYYEFMQEAMMPQRQFQTDGMSYEELLELQNQVGHVSRGLTKEQIKKIPKRTVYLRQKDGCSICYNDILTHDNIRELKCKHYYHSKCIKKWLMNEKKCPICQTEICI